MAEAGSELLHISAPQLLQERPESTHPLELIRTESLADMLNYCDLLTAAESFIFILLNVLCSKANDQLGFSF